MTTSKTWRDATPQQQQALTNEFRTLLVRTYSSALELYKNQTKEERPLTLQPADNEVTVRTTLNQPGGGQPVPMDYRMEKAANGWKVFDAHPPILTCEYSFGPGSATDIRSGAVDCARVRRSIH